MEKNKNTKEDIKFLKRIAMITGIPVLAVALFAACRCSNDNMVKNNEFTDHDGIVVHDQESSLVLRRVR